MSVVDSQFAARELDAQELASAVLVLASDAFADGLADDAEQLPAVHAV